MWKPSVTQSHSSQQLGSLIVIVKKLERNRASASWRSNSASPTKVTIQYSYNVYVFNPDGAFNILVCCFDAHTIYVWYHFITFHTAG